MDIFYSLLVIFIAIFALIQAGKYVVRSLSVLARFLSVSEYVLSFFLIALATALPELSVGINSALLGVSELSFGDILGTNIVNLTLILGAVAVVGGSINLKDYAHFKENRLIELSVMLAPLMLALDGTLSRLDGSILLVLFVVLIFRLLDIDDTILGRKVLRPHLVASVNEVATSWKDFSKHLLIFAIGVAALIVATLTIVVNAKDFSLAIGISEVLVGVLIVGTCTSLPELTIGLRSVLKKHGGVALGDIFGAAAINSTLTLGIVALISPVRLNDSHILMVGIVFTALSFFFASLFLKSKRSISRREGLLLVVLYLFFVLAQIGTLFL
ncbi:MAG: hypothetical protein WD312_03440 [Candidatus Paceibacterota bacterium]